MAETLFSLSGKRVWVAGHRGMVGAALSRRLAGEDCELVTVDRSSVDLRDQHAQRHGEGEAGIAVALRDLARQQLPPVVAA